MATIRTKHGLPAKPSEGIQARRDVTAGISGGIPRPLNRSQRPETNNPPKAAAGAVTQTRLPTRVPYSSSGRLPVAAKSPHATDGRFTASGSSIGTSSTSSASHAQSGSGSSTSSRSVDPPRNVLRRQRTFISHDVPKKDASRSASSSIPRSKEQSGPTQGPRFNREITASPVELRLAEPVEIHKEISQEPFIYPELDRYRNHSRPTPLSHEQMIHVPFKLSTHDLPPPTPGSLFFSGSSSAFSASPSTKWSGSPGPGPYSRDTTPTSISSQSPGLAAPMRFAPSNKFSPVLTRPPVTRRRTGSISNVVDCISADPNGLAAVRESLYSSSSGSTVRNGDKNLKKDVKPAGRLPQPPPSPPPRKSSQKFNKAETQSPVKAGSKVTQGSSSVSSPAKVAAASPRPSLSASPSRTATPRRPSRDGAPDLQSQLLGPVPVIHSNLSSASLQSERRGSEVSRPGSATAPQHASSSQLSVNQEFRPSSRTASATRAQKVEINETIRPSRTPSPVVTSSSRSRFNIFGRMKDNAAKEKTERKTTQARKGPAAGTGHEGYGKLGAIRRRSGSSNLQRGIAEQASQDVSGHYDSFFADRMNPVVIAGGGIKENRNASSELSRTESNQSFTSDDDNSLGSQISLEIPRGRTGLWPLGGGGSGPKKVPALRRPSDSSDSDATGMRSTIAFRRSVQRLRTSPDGLVRLPQAINTSAVASSPMTSFDTSIMSDESHAELQREISQDNNATHTATKKLTKRARSPRKWNLFGRSQTKKSEEQKATALEPVKAIEEEKKHVPFYAMMNLSEQDISEEVDIHEVLRNADIYSQPTHQPSPEADLTIYHAADSLIPPPLQPVRPVSLQRGSSQDSTASVQTRLPPSEPLSSGRPSRLPRVGRIPKVASKRREEPSPKSFSRPFRASMQALPRASAAIDPDSIAKGPSPPSHSPVPDLTMEESTGESGTNRSSRGSHFGSTPQGFLAFSPRKNSDGTLDTTSTSSGLFPLITDTTITISLPNELNVDDDVWDEYDDLLGDDHGRPPLSATSSRGIPFYLEPHDARLAKSTPLESPTFFVESRKASTYSKAPTASSCYSADMTERIRKAFQQHPSPPAPPPFPEPLEPLPERPDEKTYVSKKAAGTPRGARSPDTARQSDSSCCSSSSEDESALAQVNLRVGSMTVSKWLTFGHVLFSDARHELLPPTGSLQRQSILVVDGLGNDDWSFYAAETYPAATFFNLSPRAPLPKELQTSTTSFPLSPPNHHQIQFVSHLEKFPFAAQSFTSVVYRFPVAAPESHYRNVLAEARRVLKPGGYLELSILDVDLNNMGNRGRRAIRHLKERIHETSPDTNLASTADLLLKLIGSAGFSNIKAARVGVPVASPIARSNRKSIMAQVKNKGQASLSEMMSDDSPAADENITKMVANVGRWWYKRCYENAADPYSRSIWSDKALLRECEELGTSLKLMVCCGRAPDRVSSV